MSHASRPLLVRLLLALASLAALVSSTAAQETAHEIVVSPPSLQLKVGEVGQLEIAVLDANGEVIDVDLVIFSRSRGGIRADRSGRVQAVRPGDYEMIVRTPNVDGESVSVKVPVSVGYAEVVAIEIVGMPEQLYANTSVPVSFVVVDEVGIERDDIHPWFASSNTAVADVDEFGRLTARSEGECELVVSAEGIETSAKVRVVANPVRSIELKVDETDVRTGDVLQFHARALDADGAEVPDAPIQFACFASPDDDLGNGATGQIGEDGRFVAEDPGLYTVLATSGRISESRVVRARPRNVQRNVRLVGTGAVQDVHTSDLWVWEGGDGRDYAVTGTWGADGDTIFWDVTDPSNIERISSVRVDARTVNDVKVNPDGTLCVISREGASNRKNGIVIIDVVDPRNPEIVSTFTEDLTGGVHNLFIWNDHVFALSAGQRYDIISIVDPVHPKKVSSFELGSPGHSIHDVWVVDGIAYSSNWRDGVYMVDVGNGRAGGSLENPVVIGHYAYPSGWNHAAFPYFDEETGKFYVVAGDEAFPYGLNIEDHPTYPRGWLHFIDFTDPENPKEVARYQVPEAGSHNFWIEGDVLYAAFYNGGLRVVDISGDLMGDLYEQGREMAFYLPTDPNGKVSNAPMVWGPQPHKGKVFFSDWNSGLWAVELEQPKQ